jgi:hypothetical protein
MCQKRRCYKSFSFRKKYLETFYHPDLPYPINIGGSVDRIEERNGIIRIIDYKTGKVDKGDIILTTWNGLTEDISNDKIIQVLAYAFMFEKFALDQQMEAGIISFKNLKSGFMPFTFKLGKDINTTINKETLKDYLEQIVVLLREILDENIPFEEKV